MKPEGNAPTLLAPVPNAQQHPGGSEVLLRSSDSSTPRHRGAIEQLMQQQAWLLMDNFISCAASAPGRSPPKRSVAARCPPGWHEGRPCPALQEASVSCTKSQLLYPK